MKEYIHGAKWWKFDFHNHTPASDDFGKGDAVHKAISQEDWLLMYMNAGIDCVAITDHNTGKWIDILQAAYSAMQSTPPIGFRPIHIFPGVEITASNNVHILALFDKNVETSAISALLGAIRFPVDSFGKFDAVSPMSVEEIIIEIHKANGIAIPAHVDKASGLFIQVTGVTLLQTLRTEVLLAIEVIDKAAEKPEIYRQTKLQLAEVLGSDSHIAAQVGVNYSWIKMSEPSLDALKLALHDGEDGVRRNDDILVDPNTISNRYFIKSITVSSGYKAGNGTPLKAEFSPWLSSLIGGRGSGKSTILNYLRIALARVDEMPNEVQLEFNKFNQIGKKSSPGMLREDTSITVEVFKDGKLYLITWDQHVQTLRTWDLTTSDWDAGNTITNIKELFPVQIFSQKELYALTGDPSKLIELIDSQFDKAGWEEAKAKLIEKWIADRAKSRQLKIAISEEGNIKANLELTNNKITLYESSDYKEILSNFNKLSAVNKFFIDTNLGFSQFLTQLVEVQNAIPLNPVPSEITDVIVDETLVFLDDMYSAIAATKEKLAEAMVIINPYKGNLAIQFNSLPWFAQFEKAKQDYEGIIDRIKELGSDTYEALIQRRLDLIDKLDLIVIQKAQLTILEDELATLYNSIIDKEKELRNNRIGIINRWKEYDSEENPFLTIELHPMADADSANSSFRELIRRPGGDFSYYIYEENEETETGTGLIYDLVNEPEVSRWEKRNELIDNFVTATEADKKNLDLRLARHIENLNTNTPEDIDRLLVWVPEDKIVLKFRKQGRDEDINTGSAGERTAGMLGLLLALNDIPLIIDQPEDDLDTKLISNFVVDGFKKLKQKRQLIIVTHNPNITVNANSDNIVYMNFVSGQIVVEGNDALQHKKIREAVCEVMEGGREALNKRYYRISKALKT